MRRILHPPLLSLVPSCFSLQTNQLEARNKSATERTNFLSHSHPSIVTRLSYPFQTLLPLLTSQPAAEEVKVKRGGEKSCGGILIEKDRGERR